MNLSDIDMQEMLERIEYELASQGMNKKTFYEKSGVSSSLYSQYNTGATRPSWRSIGKMANALGVSIKYLIGMPDIEKSPSDEEELTRRLQILKDRPDLGVLLDVGADTTPEEVDALIEFWKKTKGGGNVN